MSIANIPPGTILRFRKAVPSDLNNFEISFRAGHRMIGHFDFDAPGCEIQTTVPVPKEIAAGTSVVVLRGDGSTFYSFLDIRQQRVWDIRCNPPGGGEHYEERFHTIGFLLDTFGDSIEGCVPDRPRIPADRELEQDLVTQKDAPPTPQSVSNSEQALEQEASEGDRRLEDRYCLKHWLYQEGANDFQDWAIRNQMEPVVPRKAYKVSKIEQPTFGRVTYFVDLIDMATEKESGPSVSIECPLFGAKKAAARPL
jgi:hypothetical protein